MCSVRRTGSSPRRPRHETCYSWLSVAFGGELVSRVNLCTHKEATNIRCYSFANPHSAHAVCIFAKGRAPSLTGVVVFRETHVTMLVKQFRQGLILVGLILSVSICILRFKPQGEGSLSIGALTGLHGAGLADEYVSEDASAEASDPKHKPTIFEEDENAKLWIHADEQNDAEFLADMSPKGGKTAKGRGKGNGKGKMGGTDKGGTKFKAPQIVHHEIFSQTSQNRGFFPIYMGGLQIYNPNVIPHPRRSDVWIVVGQHQQTDVHRVGAQQLVCAASFLEDALTCIEEPAVLSTEPSIKGECEGKYANYNMRPGARDARIFYGPNAPMISYGSQSSYACLGVWLQNLRSMVDLFTQERASQTVFRTATELRRPPPFRRFEKNFFLFWDENNELYVHHDLHPQRVFAKLNDGGSVGPDLAGEATVGDTACMAKYMPTISNKDESIHQATNSLLITMCRRSDYDCRPHGGNTFIMIIFHHQTYHDHHPIYEPYVMLFQSHAPFAVYAIGQKPLWIHGRGTLVDSQTRSAKATHPTKAAALYDSSITGTHPNRTQMLYITSMSWKVHGQKYHGYIDDPVFLSFGIDDERAAVMDVKAEDLVQNLGKCSGSK